jgi:outer membrane biosynthesis protein TonB
MSLRRRLVLPALCLALSFATASGAYGAEASPAPPPSAPRAGNAAEPAPAASSPAAAQCGRDLPPAEPTSVIDTLAYPLTNPQMLELLDAVVHLDAKGQRDILAASTEGQTAAIASSVDRAVREACIGRDVRFAVVRFLILASQTWDEAKVNSPAFEAFAEGPLAVALGAAALSPALPVDTRSEALRGFPSPAAPPTPAPSPCERPNRDARMLHSQNPSYPLQARRLATTGQVEIRINLDSAGRVRNALVYHTEFQRSSQEGDDALTQVSLVAAAMGIFAPEYEKCIPVAGSYLYRVVFDYH